MSVSQPNITDSGAWISLSATPEDKVLLAEIAKQDGNASQSATIRKLIRDEAKRRGIAVDKSVIGLGAI